MGDGTGPLALGPITKLVLDLRLGAVVLTLLSLPRGRDGLDWVVAGLLGAVAVSYTLLRWWDQLGPPVLRHPAFLGAEVVLAGALLAVTGPESPFLYFTLGTAFLGGLFYRWVGAAVFSALLLAVHYWALDLRSQVVEVAATFQTLVGTPALYPSAALSGAFMRRLLDRQQAAEAAVAAAEREAAAAEERARLAREMHDSLAKTLHGIALSAAALERWVLRDPAAAADRARVLARAAGAAAAEARSLVIDLRSEAVEGPLHEELERLVAAWSERTGIEVAAEVEPVAAPAGVAHELACIAREALANVDRHAGAGRVSVSLRQDAGGIELRVADDGRGFDASAPQAWAAAGHFGVLGMQERAGRAGGTLALESAPGRGTTVVARVPAAGLPAPAAATPATAGSAP